MLKADSQPRHELYFGIVGPMGTDVDAVVDALEDALKTVEYDVKQIRISNDLLRFYTDFPPDKYLEKHIENAISAGNKFREQMDDKAAAAYLAINAIREVRKKLNAERKLLEKPESDLTAEDVDFLESTPVEGVAYIIRSVKRPEEAEHFRRVYGNQFILLSVYSPKSKRIKSLSDRIAKSHHVASAKKFAKHAANLIEKDNKESENIYGQRVEEVFDKADCFLAEGQSLPRSVARFVQLLFGRPFITPTRDEFGAFLARSIAVRSADLSRQVGAVILSKDDDILATGCNEVPKCGGGAFWEDDGDGLVDYRDYKTGKDFAAVMKNDVLEEVFEKIVEKYGEKGSLFGQTPEQLRMEALGSGAVGSSGYLGSTRITGLLEFGRVVHAEMAAISAAARIGVSVKGATLYCTTFPCHMCARHIIASGVERVVFIEPYTKSMTSDLYERMVSIDGSENCDTQAVRFETFVGIAPRKYMPLFKSDDRPRKDADGFARKENVVETSPRIERFVIDFALEDECVSKLKKLSDLEEDVSVTSEQSSGNT